jgi:ribonuclease G
VSTRILVACSPGEARVAAVTDAELVDYALWRPGAPDGCGDLYIGRVTARAPAMAGAFVALPGTDGFLPDSEGGADVTAGDLLPVRVTRAAQGGKGARLTARLNPGERALAGGDTGAVRLLRRGPGAVERLAAQYPDAPVLADDLALAAALRPALGGRLQAVARAFDEDIGEQVAALAAPTVVLPGGARLHIVPTPALTAIDVDAGAASAGRRDKAVAQPALNRAAIPALARQIRLRNLSGAILVDFAGMPARRRAALGRELAAALATDPLRPRLLGFTALGLAEIVRPRRHPPMHELLAGPHAAGLAALARADAELAGGPARLLVLHAAPDVIAALEADAVALPDFSRRCGGALALQSDPVLAPGTWRLGCGG